ncbi:AAA family ATPase, partial [Bacteroidales bacterium OttesenSCG-928-M11]|nr:AAA family ATPase [Bacteroidales bacterium OttesenSCG-928-M11]
MPSNQQVIKVDNHIAFWSLCLDIIKDNIDEKVHNTWFEPIVPLKYEGSDFTIQVPSQFFYEYLEEKYADLIHATLSRVIGKDINLKYRIVVDHTNGIKGQTTLDGGKPVSALQKEATNLNKSPDALASKKVQDWNSNLNVRLTFDNYYEGTSNKLARTIGDTIATAPEQKLFNPFFLFGKSGVGKTHLCHAIGNKIMSLYPDKKVIYISSHLFQVQFTDASRKNITNDFINFYQGIDVLIIDDIHELAGKTATQNTYFHIFN